VKCALYFVIDNAGLAEIRAQVGATGIQRVDTSRMIAVNGNAPIEERVGSNPAGANVSRANGHVPRLRVDRRICKIALNISGHLCLSTI
jgi:hypothetical protein